MEGTANHPGLVRKAPEAERMHAHKLGVFSFLEGSRDV
jgi:hypothetical protein